MTNKVNITFDATQIDTFMSCPCKFDYRFNKNKVMLEKPKALDRGTLIHLGCEAYYLALQAKEDYEHCIKAMKQQVLAGASESDLDSETLSRVDTVLIEHFKHWRNTDENYEILAVETPFSYILFDSDIIRIVMTGKIDLLVNDPIEKYSNLIIDHKSYDRDFPVSRRTNQFLNYATAADTNYLLINRIGFQTSVEVSKKMRRVPLSYDPMIKQQWKDNVVSWLSSLYLECVATNNWPMNDTSCFKFNRLCEYNDICDSSGIEAKTYKLEANFKQAEAWDVSKELR